MKLIQTAIPKTGCVSFMHTLKHVYGGETNAYDTIIRGRPESDNLIYADYDARKASWDAGMKNLPPVVNFLTDHVPVQLYDGWLPDVPRVTWLRDPVKRVVSHYIHNVGDKHSRYRLQRFIHNPRFRNMMTFYTGGGNLDRFAFVGILGRYNRDLARCAELLGWPPDYPVVHLNTCKYPALKAELLADALLLAEIDELNQLDRGLYWRALWRQL